MASLLIAGGGLFFAGTRWFLARKVRGKRLKMPGFETTRQGGIVPVRAATLRLLNGGLCLWTGIFFLQTVEPE